MAKHTVSVICLVAMFGFAMPYPDEDAEVLSEPLEMKTYPMPESCKSKNMEFCFDNTDYPLDIVEELVKDMTNLQVAKEDDVGLIENRQGNADEDDCRAQATNDPIYYIVDEFGRDRVVVQIKDKFQQRYSVTWCEKEGRIEGRTEHFLATAVSEHNMSCENKYMQYEFLVLSLKPDILGKWNMERARTKSGIPVCCACRYQK